MRMAYFIVRMVSYACGIAAVLLIMWGGRSGEGLAGKAGQVGYLLLLAMFVLFCISYVLFALIRRNR